MKSGRVGVLVLVGGVLAFFYWPLGLALILLGLLAAGLTEYQRGNVKKEIDAISANVASFRQRKATLMAQLSATGPV